MIGVRPVTQIWTLADGVRQTERFPLIETTPGGRLFEYSRKARGNNSSYYSIFRSAPFLSLMRLFVEEHPTKGGYIDWAICLALFASGRVLHDPSLVYRYDLGRWAEAESLRQTKAKLFTDAGLPDGIARGRTRDQGQQCGQQQIPDHGMPPQDVVAAA